MVFILKVNNIQEKKFEPHCLRAPVQFLIKGLVRNEQGGGGWKQRGGHNFLSLRKGRGHEKCAVKRGRVMQIYARDHLEVHPQKKKEVLYLAKTREKNNGLRNAMDINCEVL